MILVEATRKELIRKCQHETPLRYKKRIEYARHIKPIVMTRDLFISTGTLVVPMEIGDYVVTININGVLPLIREELDKQNKTYPDRMLVYKALRRAVDTSQVYVNCTCPDYKYRFRYLATRNKYNYGTPETRPANITNPDNNGSVCKHITAALTRPSQWLKYVAGWISTEVRAYLKGKININIDGDNVSPAEEEDVKDTISNIQNLGPESDDDSEVEVELDEE
jgi:hypothetical protein